MNPRTRDETKAAAVTPVPQAKVSPSTHEVHIRPLRREPRVVAQFRPELLHHRLVGVRHENHRVRHAGIQRVHRQKAGAQRDFLAQLEVPGLSQIDRHSLALKCRGDDPRAGLESRLPFRAGLALDEAGETTRAVAAHVRGAAITVVKLPGPVGLARRARNQQEQPVRPDSALTIAEANNLFASEPDLALPVVDEHKIISRPVHLGEFQSHAMQP